METYAVFTRVQTCSDKNIFLHVQTDDQNFAHKTEKTLIKSEFFCGYIFFVAL